MQNKSKKQKCFRVRVGPSFRKITNTLFACDIEPLANHYTNIANAYIRTNGHKWTCERLKAYYNIGCKIALRLNVERIPFCKTRGNIPRDMVPFLSFLKSPDLNRRRACLTVLRSYTQIYCQVSKETTSIEQSGPSESAFQRYEVNFVKVCEKFKKFSNPKIVDEGLFTTSKAGPNGHAMLNCDKDFAAIKGTELLNDIICLNKEIEKISTIPSKREVNLSDGFCPDFDGPPDEDMIGYLPRSLRKEQLYKAMDNFTQWRVKADPNVYNSVKHSKLSFLSEGGCKTRVIAIGDYFTQDCLKPIHKSLYKILNKLSTDGTSSHNRISQLVKERTGQNALVRSFDLTNATDRFPAFIQERVLSELYNPEIGRLWRRIMTKRSFFVEDAKYIEYGQGQPMGLLSSWAAFALTHHIIIETCAAVVGYQSFKDYVVIGDDVTIFNKTVSEEYCRFLETFNIEISKSKSLESEGNPSSAEIAKRIFINGNEISPIPYDAIESSINNFLLFPNLARLCIERDVQIDISHNTPVQGTLEAVYSRSTALKVLAILSFPVRALPLTGIRSEIWDESLEIIQETFNELCKEFISSRAKGLYENELSNIPNMGALGSALESDNGPDLLNLHPLFTVLRAYRDRCGSIHQGITIRGLRNEDLGLIPFLVNPMIPNYIRRTHQIERVKSTLILKTLQRVQLVKQTSS